MTFAPEEQALLELLRELALRRYSFVTPTPATHARVIARPENRVARDLRGVFGWSLPFPADLLDPALLRLMETARVVSGRDGLLVSGVRVSTLHGILFLHSRYPTDSEDAVFLGPDSYRFADFIVRELSAAPASGALVDIGAGAGVGALAAATRHARLDLTATDINPEALRLARINAAARGVRLQTVHTDGLRDLTGGIDIALANPPYVIDARARAYRDGGGLRGGQVSLDMAREAASRLNRGGRLLLYTGSAIVAGEDRLRVELEQAMEAAGCTFSYRELDPDVFGEELERPQYAQVERIAVVAMVAVRR